MTFGEKMKFKADQRKAAWQQRVGAVKDWCRLHPQEATMLGIVIVGTTGKVIQSALAYKAKTKQIDKQRVIYDPSAGMYQCLNKPMNYEQQRAYNALVADGMKRGEALRALGLV